MVLEQNDYRHNRTSVLGKGLKNRGKMELERNLEKL